MRLLAKLIIIILCFYAIGMVTGYVFNKSIVFPFTIIDGLSVPEYKLQAVRLATASTFAYFGVRYLFFQITKLYPIQFLGVFLFFLSTVGSIAYYKHNVNLSEYFVSLFFLITSIILYQAGKPEFRNYFRHK